MAIKFDLPASIDTINTAQATAIDSTVTGTFTLDGYIINPAGAILNQVLKYNGSEFAVADSSFAITPIKTSTYTAVDNELVRCNPTGAGFTINLPTAFGSTAIIIKNQSASSNTITITPNGADTIDGAASFTISVARGFVTLYSDGVSDWMVV